MLLFRKPYEILLTKLIFNLKIRNTKHGKHQYYKRMFWRYDSNATRTDISIAKTNKIQDIKDQRAENTINCIPYELKENIDGLNE